MLTAYPFTDEGLRAAVARLGRRPHKIHRTLRKHGCLGDPNSCNSCPVVVWLQRALGTDDVVVDEAITVTRDLLVDEGHGRYYEATEVVSIDTPAVVAAFMKSMDGLQYPDLIKQHPKEPPA